MAILRSAPDNVPSDQYNNMEKFTGAASTAWEGAQAFTVPCKEVVIRVGNRGAQFKFSKDGDNWSGEIYVPNNCTMMLKIDAHSFDIKCAVSGGACYYTVMGFYIE